MKQNSHEILERWRGESAAILRDIGQEMKLARGEKLGGTDIYYNVEGLWALCFTSAAGREMAMIYLGAGRLMNFMPVLMQFYLPAGQSSWGAPANHYFKALEPSRVLRISASKFLELFFTSWPLHSLIIHSLVDNFDNLFCKVSNLREMPAWQRVARLMLVYMDRKPPHKVFHNLTYGDAGTYLDLHPVTVAKIVKAFQEDGIIERRGRNIRVLDPQALETIGQGAAPYFYKSGR